MTTTPAAISPRLMTLEAAAAYLGRKVSSTRSLIYNGHLRVVRVPGERRLYVDVRDLDRLIDRFKTGAGE